MNAIDPKRMVIGVFAGAAVPIVIITYIYAPIWPFILIGAIIWAALLIPLFIIPVYLFLRAKQILTLFWAAFLGGSAAALPFLIMSAIGTIGPSTVTVTEYSGRVLVDNGVLTNAGWYTYFIHMPGLMFCFGAVGGLIAWLIAIGWQFKPNRSAEHSESI